ncbi:MAG: hypothetical protein UIG59_07225 [Acutalibacteraceae bacterium]|nr:hypothetical protein [Acutalibacteraceae bacterium]
MNDNVIKRYLKTALKKCPSAYRKRISGNLSDSLFEFVEENPAVNEEALVENFGPPERYAEEYIASLDDEEKVRLLAKNTFIMRAITITIAIGLIILAVGTAIIVIDSINSSSNYYEVVIGEESVIYD